MSSEQQSGGNSGSGMNSRVDGSNAGHFQQDEHEQFPQSSMPQQEQQCDQNERRPDAYIKLRVISQESGEVYFKVKANTVLSKLMKSYSDRIGLPLGTLRFMFDGRRINDHETAKQLGMDDEDCIEVYQEQVGGFSIFA